MSEAIDAVGSIPDEALLLNQIEHYAAAKTPKGLYSEEELLALKERERSEHNPHAKLETVQGILNDRFAAIESAEEKEKAIAAVLNNDFPTLGTPTASFSNPEEKLSEIKEVVTNKSLYNHPHEKFASIEAILHKHTNSSNPWVQAHQSLSLVEDSSRKIIKAEEKRQKEMREMWKSGTKKKAELYPEMAWDQKKWQYASMALMGASFAAPVLSREASGIAGGLQPLINRVRTISKSDLQKLIEGGLNKVPDLVNNMGTQTVQVGSQTSTLEKKDRETLHDWETQQERQDLESQQQLVQEARQNDNSLKERHLEVIKTLTSMVTSR